MMVYSYSDTKKAPGYRIHGQTKPFIDNNLQLHLPSLQKIEPSTTLEESFLAWKKLIEKTHKKHDP